MSTGAITQYIDVAQVVLYAFWAFFAGLIFYLHRENKREGYPLENEGAGGRVVIQGFPPIPSPKTYLLRSGRVVTTPNPERDEHRPDEALFSAPAGSAQTPNGDSIMSAGIGPGGYAMRADVPDTTFDDRPRIVPLRVQERFSIDTGDTDPRGFPVIGVDGVVGGTVRDLWVDRSENLFRYLEVDVAGQPGAKPVLLPMGFARIKSRRVQVDSITGAQFAAVPRTRSDEQVTLFEEERVMAYYGAGTLYATRQRQEPLL